ncbi:MAG: DUF559 domain-containing protein [Saprospiraceae bacterium]|nr:DUF559 domain-containing protein [Saprospiraceae bacterium]
MATPPNDNNNVLVALLKEPHDWQIVCNYGIYRIRGSLRYPPPALTEKRVQILGFYLPSKFGKHKFSIRHYARVRNISMAPRHECVPNEPRNSKSEAIYYKFELEHPERLAEPIVSYRGRSHMVLIPTTEDRFFDAPELNFLYKGSQLEEQMWKALLDKNIFPERQYPVHTRDENAYLLDFAVFCQKGRFAIETDGPQHQATRDAVLYDNRRDNRLSVEKWDVMRYPPEEIAPDKIERTIVQINDKITSLGGLDTFGGLLPNKPTGPSSSQFALFHDAHLDYLALRRRILEKYEKGK